VSRESSAQGEKESEKSFSLEIIIRDQRMISAHPVTHPPIVSMRPAKLAGCAFRRKHEKNARPGKKGDEHEARRMCGVFAFD